MLEKEHQDSLRIGYEVTDANAHGIVAVAVGSVVTCAAIFALLVGLFHIFARDVPAEHAARSGLPALEQLPPEPRLQLDPRADLRRLRNENAAILNSAAWIDQRAGIARIPIDDAMELLVRKRGRP